VTINNAVSEKLRMSHDEAWNAAAAHAQGLRERIAELEAQRVPLTKAEITACCNESDTYKTGVWMRVHETTLERLVRAIERAHGVEEVKR
jgi:ATP phosphoribosyltransferase regulatory subunit HisZ